MRGGERTRGREEGEICDAPVLRLSSWPPNLFGARGEGRGAKLHAKFYAKAPLLRKGSPVAELIT